MLIPLPRPSASCLYLKFFPAFGGRLWGQDRVKESKASSAALGMEVRTEGRRGELLPPPREGCEALGIARFSFACF